MVKSTRYYSNIQEKNVAKITHGKQNVNSGATLFVKGDVSCDNVLIECKTSITDKNSYSIKKEVLTKNKKEAFAMNKDYSALCFNFGPSSKNNYYVIDENMFLILLEQLQKS